MKFDSVSNLITIFCIQGKIIAKKGSEAADDKVTDLSGPKKWDKVRIKEQKLPDKHSIFLGGPESKKVTFFVICSYKDST